jgi:hypothetical protein
VHLFSFLEYIGVIDYFVFADFFELNRHFYFVVDGLTFADVRNIQGFHSTEVLFLGLGTLLCRRRSIGLEI